MATQAPVFRIPSSEGCGHIGRDATPGAIAESQVRPYQRDRNLFFTLTVREREALEQRRSIRTKIHFLRHLGYFRARQRFFRFELLAVRDNVNCLRRRYFDNHRGPDLGPPVIL